MKKLRVRLYAKGPKAGQTPETIIIDVPRDAMEFEDPRSGKRYRLTGAQGGVYENDQSGLVEADAVEC
jgi:hypothetical protein